MIRRYLSALRPTLGAAMLTASLLSAVAFGQEEATGPTDNSSWVLGYALVILGIALGLVAVCRPGNRSAEVRMDDE